MVLGCLLLLSVSTSGESTPDVAAAPCTDLADTPCTTASPPPAVSTPAATDDAISDSPPPPASLTNDLTTEELTQILYEVYSYPPLPPAVPLTPHSIAAAALKSGGAAAMPAHAGIEPLSLTSPSHLSELNHYVFGGRRDFCRPFRVLVAGGGTGQKTANLMAQLVDMNRKRIMNDRRSR